MEKSHNEWLNSLTAKKAAIDTEKQRNIQKEALGNHTQDVSLPIFERLIQDGYTTCTWDAGNSRHSACRELDRQVWDIHDFISGLNHSAPIFEKSHPGDTQCKVIVSGQGLPDVIVDPLGNVL